MDDFANVQQHQTADTGNSCDNFGLYFRILSHLSL